MSSTFIGELPLQSPPAPEELEISLFGPGYGECVICHLGGGRWLVVDSAWDALEQKPVALSYLPNLGVDVSNQVDGIVATHWHDDHVRGLSTLVDAAPKATFFCSQALRSSEFLRLTHRPIPSRFSSGTDEISKVSSIYQGRSTGNRNMHFIGANTRLWTSSATVTRDVWALSPSPEDIHRALQHMASLLPADTAAVSRVPAVEPNDTSVVLLLSTDVGDVLLGADLEHFPTSRHRGWHAILDDKIRPPIQAEVFKASHHGAVSGDCPEVWDTLLASQSITLVSPFQRGSVDLPTAVDVARLSSRHSKVYVTNGARQQRPVYDQATMRTIRESTRNFRSTGAQLGHVQVRRLGGVWTVRATSSAASLN